MAKVEMCPSKLVQAKQVAAATCSSDRLIRTQVVTFVSLLVQHVVLLVVCISRLASLQVGQLARLLCKLAQVLVGLEARLFLPQALQ
jgi:hypothetical protein